jgi:hypothetical protein
MSSDDKTDPRKKQDSEDADVMAHRYMADEAADDDPLRKRKRKRSEEAEADEFGRKRK